MKMPKLAMIGVPNTLAIVLGQTVAQDTFLVDVAGGVDPVGDRLQLLGEGKLVAHLGKAGGFLILDNFRAVHSLYGLNINIPDYHSSC